MSVVDGNLTTIGEREPGMRSFYRMGGGLGVVTAMMAAPVSAPSASASGQFAVACDATALASAVIAANASPAILRLAPRCVYNITSQLPQITGNVVLVGGPSTTIRHDPATAANFRLLDVGASGGLRVIGIFLRNGNPAGNGGGVQNAGRLVLDHVTLNGNLAGASAVAGGNGGALANLPGARALVARSVISSNEAIRALAETGTGNGGGIDNAGDLTIFASRLVANNATSALSVAGTGNGGGLATQPGGVSRVIQATINENTATNAGGGVFNAGTTSLIRSLVLRNRATIAGGVFGSVTLRRSIVRGNTPDNCVPAAPACN
ncbi:hypothetical protein [Actinoallomurus acaciae]|uniref:Outer membrane repeat protein n=1 Tax=Actinoallomurus acaciae TaxID=502577 RepID=A0ABV5YN49_9ACTN